MRTYFTLLLLAFISVGVSAQNILFNELENPAKPDMQKWAVVKKAYASWGSTDIRYKKEEPASGLSKALSLTSWKNERVSAQAVVSTPSAVSSLTIEAGDLQGPKGKISKDNVKTSFVRYVMTDCLSNTGNECGTRKPADFDSSLVADILDDKAAALPLKENTTQPLWISINVPEGTPAGVYKGSVCIKADGQTIGQLPYTLKVLDRTLPDPKDWHFDLDLWQNPYAVARFYNVTPFSKGHLEVMKPVMEHYAKAGGKAITTSITYKPWNGQTEDPFDTMITWIKRADGTWLFDYTVFDIWVEFMMGLGVTERIGCYSMVPWRLSFQYYDQATNSLKFIDCKPGEKEYTDFWGPMLKDFARHLKEKGWFSKTYIAMDERPKDIMQATYKVIKDSDKDWKISLAGSYHKELSDMLDYYSITLNEEFDEDVLAQRKKEGRTATFYTCCAEPRPNTFTFSDPAEAEWIGWHAARKNLDGYLRWAFNSWVINPFQDSRFRTWAAGDTYIVYPYGMSSIRFERLREGIMAYEKVRILKEELSSKGDVKSIEKIEKALKEFDEKKVLFYPAADAVNNAKKLLNTF